MTIAVAARYRLPYAQLAYSRPAGVPAILAAGAISPLLVKHTLQHVPKNKRQEVWHAHAILLLEESELLDEWYVRARVTRWRH